MNTPSRQCAGFTLVEIMIVVAIIAMLAAIAVPAFQKVRRASQDSAVTNNLRQLSGAANQFFLERGFSSVARDELVGQSSSQYIRALSAVAGESYPDVLIQGSAVTATAVSGTRTITYSN
jgi:type IV pilus assembly protein PilA